MTPGLWTFVALAAVIVFTPGPAVVLILKSALGRGASSALVTAAGVFVADLIWVAVSVVGLTAILLSSAIGFNLVRAAGAAYLLFLGIRLLLTREAAMLVDASQSAAVGVSWPQAFQEGFFSELSNPKSIVVYASVIPQFVRPEHPVADVVLLGVIFAVLGFVSLLSYAVLFGVAEVMLTRPKLTQNLLRAAGVLLIVFALGLILSNPAGP